MNENTNNEEHDEEYDEECVIRDLHRRPRGRKYREFVLISGERVKRNDIRWSKKNIAED